MAMSKTNGSFACIPGRVVGMQDLRAYDFRVLVAIAMCADKQGRARPSHSHIASTTGIDRRNVPRAITRLEKAGLMRHRQQKGQAGGWTHSVYEILFDPAVQEVEHTPKAKRDEGENIAQHMLAIWREECGDALSVPRALDRKRAIACSARFKDSFDRDFEQWRLMCREIRKSAFCCGGGRRGWKADFDWALKPKSIRNLLEGKYRDGESLRRHRAAAAGPSDFDEYIVLPLGPGGT
jgi:DNA-binding IscR family transcriptional regulator